MLTVPIKWIPKRYNWSYFSFFSCPSAVNTEDIKALHNWVFGSRIHHKLVDSPHKGPKRQKVSFHVLMTSWYVTELSMTHRNMWYLQPWQLSLCHIDNKVPKWQCHLISDPLTGVSLEINLDTPQWYHHTFMIRKRSNYKFGVSFIFITLENAICEMSAIVFQPLCVNT